MSITSSTILVTKSVLSMSGFDDASLAKWLVTHIYTGEWEVDENQQSEDHNKNYDCLID